MRTLLIILVLLLLSLQYRLWWGEGGRLELYRLEEQARGYEQENEMLRERNAALTRQILDLKEGQAVLEQRAREELGLIGDNEVIYHFSDPDTSSARPPGAPP